MGVIIDGEEYFLEGRELILSSGEYMSIQIIDCNIQKIEIIDCNLMEISIEDCIDLIHINLSNNKLQEFSIRENIETLLLNNNELKKLTVVSENLSTLEIMDNNLESNVLLYCPNLEHAKLNNNKLKELPIKMWTYLKTIDISNNYCIEVDIESKYIESVKANKNPLSKLVFNVESQNLKILECNNTELNTITLYNTPNIEYIDINKSFLKSFIMKTYSKKLKHFSLLDNRLLDILIHENCINPKYDILTKTKIFRI